MNWNRCAFTWIGSFVCFSLPPFYSSFFTSLVFSWIELSYSLTLVFFICWLDCSSSRIRVPSVVVKLTARIFRLLRDRMYEHWVRNVPFRCFFAFFPYFSLFIEQCVCLDATTFSFTFRFGCRRRGHQITYDDKEFCFFFFLSPSA